MPEFAFLDGYAKPARRYAAGTTLFRAGMPSAGMYLLLEGRVDLLRPLADGGEVRVHRADAVDCFAEAAVFSPIYHCDAMAVTDVVLRIVPAASVRSALSQVPDFALGFAERLARQVQHLRARTEILSIRGATERVMAWLVLNADGATVALDRPVRAVAGEIGLTHEALYRALAELERSGRIQRPARGRFTLSGPPAR